jgi:hypothetical protein
MKTNGTRTRRSLDLAKRTSIQLSKRLDKRLRTYVDKEHVPMKDVIVEGIEMLLDSKDKHK